MRLLRARFLHSTRHQRKLLIGPPDPLSNLRPVLYDGLPDEAKTNAYSQRDLRAEPVDSDQFHLNLALQRLNNFNQAFWFKSNHRFLHHRESFLKQHASSVELAKTPEDRQAMEQQHLAQFYAHWVQNERLNQREYTRQWLRGQYGTIWSAATVAWRRWWRSIGLN